MKTTDYYRRLAARQQPSPSGALQRLQQARNALRQVLGRRVDQRNYGSRVRRP